MDYKKHTKETYDKYPEKMEEKFTESFSDFGKAQAELFLKHLRGKKVLDLGSGPGDHALFFKEKGCDVLCADFSEKMLESCRRKGLKTRLMDVEDLDLPEKSFDGVWAHAILLHIPKKKVPGVIKKLWKVLKPGGLLGVAVREGDKEGYETNYKYPGTKRWFTDFQDKEVRELFAGRFEITHSSRTNVKNKYVFLHYLMKKD